MGGDSDQHFLKRGDFIKKVEDPWFRPKQRKTNLIKSLTLRALEICSKSTLKHKLDNIRSILVENGYPEFIIDLRMSKNFLRFQQNAKEDPKKCPVYLKLPWIGKNSLKFDRKIKSSIHNCFGAVQPRVVFLPENFYCNT